MNKRVPIAEIKLAPGEAGYYDEYSRIYLSSYHPSAIVYSGTNCTQIKKSIKSGRLRLVRGGFETPQPIEETTTVVTPEIKEEIIKPEVQEEIKQEEVIVEEAPVVSEIQEEVAIVIPEEEPQQEEEVKVEKEEVKTNKRKSRKATKVEE